MKPIIIFLLMGLILTSSVFGAAWDLCTKYTTVKITNNNVVYPMIEHDVNISLDTTNAFWEAYRGGIYVTDTNNAGTRFARQWWNQTAFNSVNTILWFKTNVSAGSSDGIF